MFLIYLTAIDLCDPNPCEHGSCANDGSGGYTCDCYDGYSGDDCDTGELSSTDTAAMTVIQVSYHRRIQR